jgi:hypothetical protein
MTHQLPIRKGNQPAERFWTPNLMQLLTSRDYPVIDYQTMGEFIGRERLFRATHMSPTF